MLREEKILRKASTQYCQLSGAHLRRCIVFMIINSSVTFGQKYILLCKEYLSNKGGENERREQGPETSRAFQMSAKQISTSDGL